MRHIYARTHGPRGVKSWARGSAMWSPLELRALSSSPTTSTLLLIDFPESFYTRILSK